ncbi:MAG: hypothetical protein [Circular genetic element sp.]|nr:MAG: hypothetical protein [Circular genetic element sp.]
MAKSLGQIHTCNFKSINVNTAGYAGSFDLPGTLTSQLSRMVRAGNMFKVVGIDLTLDNFPAATTQGSVSGVLRYYAPTRGRCAAFRGAFKAMADQMKIQGISMRDNAMYDFTVPVSQLTTFHRNQATLDGVTGLALNHSTTAASIFDVHNQNTQPIYTGTAGDLFNGGFNTLLQSGAGTDFVLNDTVPFEGNSNFADLEPEEIPFVLSWDSTGTQSLSTYQWRPDPALYLAIMCGQLEVIVEQTTVPSASLQLNAAVMVSGWKSIMGNPDKKPRRSRKAKKGGK